MLLNKTLEDRFILLGLYEYPHLKPLLFLIFLLAYLFCLLENTILILIICLDSHLHNPMYFFLCNLSVLDICFTSLVLPKFLLTFLGLGSISYLQCMTQAYMFIGLQSAEFILLTVMSYDRYVAICNPLKYNIVLNKKACVLLASVTWILGIADPVPIMKFMSCLSFCRNHTIDHLFCDIIPLLVLSCDDVSQLEALIFLEGGSLLVLAFFFTLISYIFVINVITKIKTTGGRSKAFSSCSAHLSVVAILYLSLIFLYLLKPSKQHSHNAKATSILNMVVVPMLNPLLYSLRNTEVKSAFYRCIRRLRILCGA